MADVNLKTNIDFLAELKNRNYNYDSTIEDLTRHYAQTQPEFAEPDVVQTLHRLFLSLAMRDKSSQFPALVAYLKHYRINIYNKLLPLAITASNPVEYGDLGRLMRTVLLDNFRADVPSVNKFLLAPEPLPAIRSSLGGMQEFVDSVRYSIATENWFGALFMALALPDICAAVEFYAVNPLTSKRSVGQEYKDWFNRYLKPKYDATNLYDWLSVRQPAALQGLSAEGIEQMKQPDPKMALWRFTAEDCYLFRCKALHQGLSQRGNDSSSKIHFSPPTGATFHQTLMRGQWWLAIDFFAEDVCQAVEKWLVDVQNDTAIQTGLAELMTI